MLIGASIAALDTVGYWMSTGPSEAHNVFLGFGALAPAYLVFEEPQAEAHELWGALMVARCSLRSFRCPLRA